MSLKQQISATYNDVEDKAVGWMRPEEKKSLVDLDKLDALDAKREKKKEKKQKEEEFRRIAKQLPVAQKEMSIHAQPGAQFKPKGTRSKQE